MRAHRLRGAQAYILALTIGVVVVVGIIVAFPGRIPLPQERIWVRFRDEDAPPGGPAALAATARVAGTTWRESAVRRSATGIHIHYEQILEGRPVVGAWAREHVLGGGRRVVTGRMTALRGPGESRAAPPDPIAIARAATGVVRLRAPASTRAALLPTPRGLLPVTVVTLPGSVPLADFVVTIEDRSGELLAADDILSRSGSVGDVFLRNPDLGCDEGPGTSDATLAPYVSTVTLSGLDGSGYLDGRYVRTLNGGDERATSSSGSFRYPPSNDGFEQVMCYYTITTYFTHVRALGVEGYEGNAVVADAHGYPGDNSFYSPTTGQLSFGDGGVPDGQDAEIILHELGHALHHRAQPSYPYSHASRAISEGIADYLACSYFGDPLVAEWDASAYSEACPPHLRRVDLFFFYPDDITGSVHADGQIWSSALWSVRDELGADVTDRVLLESLFLLPEGAGFRDAAAAFLWADDLLNAGTNRERSEQVFRERGLLDDGSSPEVATPSIFARALPNPFRERSTIRYVLPAEHRVRVDIVDAGGRVVRTLLDAHEHAGSHAIDWDGRDERGRSVQPGVYLYHITSNALTASGKLVRLP